MQLNKKFKRLFCLIAVMLLGNFLFCQTLSGKVSDSLGQPIAYANIIANLIGSDAIITFTSTDKNGDYFLNFKKKDKYSVKYSALSYKKDSVVVDFRDSKEIIKNIVLKENITELNEVIIQSERPIIIKKDTIIYNVSAFLKGNETVVEDILKNLPGITVEADGTVKIGEQEVEKIMVEGDDFFKKGYKLLSKNLNSDVVNKVEVYQKYSNNKLLKDIENSERVALNLTLKEDRKVDWFGNISSFQGGGNNYLYSGSFNLMSFGKKAKHYFLGNANNIGESSGGNSVFYADVSDIKDVGTIGNGEFSNRIISLQGFNLSIARKRYNFNNAEMVSFNSIFKLSEKIKLKTNILFDWDETRFRQRSVQNFNTSNEQFTNIEQIDLNNDKFKFYTELDFDYDISDTKTLEIDIKYTRQLDDNFNVLDFNNSVNSENLIDDNKRLDHKVIYTNKLNKKTALVFSGRYIFEELPQDYTINNFLYEDLFPTVDANNTQQISNNKINIFGLESHLLKRLKNDNLLEIKSGLLYRRDMLNSLLTLKGEEQNTTPNGYENSLDYQVGDFYVFGKYKFEINKFSVNPKIEFHYLDNHKKSFRDKSDQSVFYINPSIAFGYKLNKSNKFNLAFSTNTSNADVINVFDNYILQNFRIFNRGTNSFNQIEATSANFNYSLGNWSSSFFSNFSIGYLKNHNFFSSNRSISQNFSQITAIVIEDREQWQANLKIDQYLDFISSNVKFKFQYSNSNFKNIVNSTQLRKVDNENYTYGFEIRSAFDGFLNYHLGTTWQKSEIKTNVAFTNSNNNSFLDVNLDFEKLNIDFKSERYYYGNLDTNNTYYFFDIISKFNFKPNGLSITLKALNILNTETFREVFVSDVNTSINEYRLLPRFILLGVDFRF